MASYNIPILIQKLDYQSETWSDYYPCRSHVNKVGGKEHFNASTNISVSNYSFKIRYCQKIEDILFNTEIYRVVYKNRYFDIKNVDRFEESKTEVNIIGEFNGKPNSIN